jgi:hypothetical protein
MRTVTLAEHLARLHRLNEALGLELSLDPETGVVHVDIEDLETLAEELALLRASRPPDDRQAGGLPREHQR